VKIERLRGRSAYHALAQHGRRVRRGAVTLAFLADQTETPPRVGFAVGRRVGPAVTRNRVRRRLRAIMQELAGQAEAGLASGAYLVGAGPAAATQSYRELKGQVAECLAALESRDGSRR
jgi:ribonuclease P protein component